MGKPANTMQAPVVKPAATDEIRRGERFGFGRNWARFLEKLTPSGITDDERSIQARLETDNLEGKRFLDAGSGSGLFSLAARNLGAQVHAFDFDPDSVGCTAELKRRYHPEDPEFHVEQGSVLDVSFLAGLGRFDVVYSWGVLHHTGDMWQAFRNIDPLVESDGRLVLAIYNDQGGPSRRWAWVKRAYNRLPGPLRFLVLWPACVKMWWKTMLIDLIKGRPFHGWRHYDEGGRGMTPWRDVVDWVGGYPFEVAKPEEIFDFFKARGYSLLQLKTCGGSHGCNEYVFRKDGGEG